ncbi:MAG: DUF1844 domain-containing protein [Pedosphaera sp.]|nr:DUF1844 domain-containing protein [Pedosphaera sp.]
MSEPTASANPTPEAHREKLMTALFVAMVQHQTETALMMLGHLPHSETGEHVFDPETAQLVIEQLAMLSVKTKGNLSADEDKMLKKCLQTLQMAFMETMKHQAAAAGASPILSPSDAAPAAPTAPLFAMAPATPVAAAAPVVQSSSAPPAPAAEDDSSARKRFVKKYEA